MRPGTPALNEEQLTSHARTSISERSDMVR